MTNTEFTALYQPLESKLMPFAMRLTRNREDALDLIQETAYRAYGNRDKFQMGTNFKGWVKTIMRNTFINKHRKDKRRKTVSEPLDTFLFAIENKSTVANGAYSSIMMKEIDQMMEDIGESYSIPFLMFFRGYQYDEIAEHMDIPVGTVKSRIFFARKKLKTLIQDRYESVYVRRA